MVEIIQSVYTFFGWLGTAVLGLWNLATNTFLGVQNLFNSILNGFVGLGNWLGNIWNTIVNLWPF